MTLFLGADSSSYHVVAVLRAPLRLAMSVVDELFNIFTHYALIGDPHDPEHIKATHFQKFARDCQMLRQ